MAPSAVIKPDPHSELQFDQGYAQPRVAISEYTPTPDYPHLPMSSGDTVPDDITMGGVNMTDTNGANGSHIGYANSHAESSTSTGMFSSPPVLLYDAAQLTHLRHPPASSNH